MDVTGTDTETDNCEKILFSPLRCWNPVSRKITIFALYNGKRVRCSISVKVLRIKFHLFRDKGLQLINNYLAEIETAAIKLIWNGEYERDGSILIRHKDL